ncbi:phage tail protein I [Palleronia caenipelagi]|uniref:Phage tail protein I n=1 Tax=Palleronia caenipelagi TaxID=2489174 RepID=A0A547PS50_9RHOB|nr:phage tail protein I [Palleronia caenipelagi]TRD16968.1 phage tail protein I [Palleronia caenipelagi]
MSEPRETLLPPTAPPLVQALDRLEERLFGLPVDAITKDPLAVPAGWLDALAWEHSVDVWNPDWSEETKRQVIAVAEEVHRYKGTPYGIRAALAGLGLQSRVTEWFETTPPGPRGTFEVTAFSGEPLVADQAVFIDATLAGLVTSVVERAAPVSRGFAVTIGARLRLRPLGVAAGLRALTVTRGALTLTQAAPQLRIAPTTGAHLSPLNRVTARLA